MKELSELPVFPRKDLADFDPETWHLQVDGLVAHPLTLSYSEVLALPRLEDTSPFECIEGWRVSENNWQGVSVATLLDRIAPLPEARFVTFHAGDFIMSLSLEEARAPGVLLAYGLNGAPLAREHGAPLRLVVPGKDCFYGVKWVERVELTREARDTGKDIALGRIQARQAQG
jgi:DMSO/TMAO reductase YedYZ molybdopterin-dependent catalytic subunit